MQHLANIARYSLIALVWFTAMLGFAMSLTLLLSIPYEMLDLSPMARTLSTMALSIAMATTIAGLSWYALRRATHEVIGPMADHTEGGDASFARTG